MKTLEALPKPFFLPGLTEDQLVANTPQFTPDIPGRKVGYRLTATEVCVWDPYDSYYIMRAYVEDPHTLRLFLYTQFKMFGLFWQRHPAMYAGDFVRFSINYMEKQGTDINTFQAVWLKGEQNWNQYQKELRRHQDPVEAAKKTWTGRIISQFGFTIVSEDKIKTLEKFIKERERVEVLFLRNPHAYAFKPQVFS